MGLTMSEIEMGLGREKGAGQGEGCLAGRRMLGRERGAWQREGA